jgi:hypothetical protein
MDCLLKLSVSLTLKNLIEKIVQDSKNHALILTTEDWKSVAKLDSSIENRVICKNQCLGCLEYYRTVKIFNELTSSIQAANEKNASLIKLLCQTFKIDEPLNPVSLAVDLTTTPDYVKTKIDNGLIPDYEKYVRNIAGSFHAMAMDHYYHEQAKSSDTVFSYAYLEHEQVIAYFPFEKPDNEKSFYLDQNIISQYSNDANLKKQVNNFKTKTNYKFIYSPYVIEDGIKMSRVRLTEYFETIQELTDGIMLARTSDKVVFVKENIETTKNRVLLWKESTRAFEDCKINKMLLNQIGYSHFSRNSRFSKRANINLESLLESLRPHLENDDFEFEHDDYESDQALCRRLYAFTIEKSFSLEDLVNRTITFENDSECIEHIEHLCEFLDHINYKTEPLSDHDKIRSSVQDSEHLKHAWKADYFVTDDIRLRARGEFIYSTLKLKTRFIDLKELKNIIITEFKQHN